MGFEGMIFHVSHDSVTKVDETAVERDAHLAKNAHRQCRQDAEAAPEAGEDGRGLSYHQRNLAAAFNELNKLPHTPEVKKFYAHIIASQV